MSNEEQSNRRASLLLSRVRAELAENTDSEPPSVRTVIAEVAHRIGVSYLVEDRAQEAWVKQEPLILSSRCYGENPKRVAIIGLAFAAAQLRRAA